MWTRAFQRKTAENVVNFLEIIFNLGGPNTNVPLSIGSDNGLEFVNERFRDLCEKYQIQVTNKIKIIMFVYSFIPNILKLSSFSMQGECLTNRDLKVLLRG